MSRRWLSFDLEIAALNLDDGGDWKARRPLGITCAALAWQTDNGAPTTVTWNGWQADAENEIFQLPAPRMSKEECVSMVRALMIAAQDGYTLLTWNGLSFDLDILAEESGMHAECVELAMNHVDMMFQVLCIKGFPLGLDAAAKGMGLAGKTEGMDGAKAPQMWAAGEYETVLSYVQQDVRTTLEVALAVERTGYLHWIARSGKSNAMRVERWLTVREAMTLPMPDVSWMTSPLPRSKFVEWMQANQPT